MNINNIWFLRLDKLYITDDSGKEIDTLNCENPYLYSMHGICSNKSIEDIKNNNKYPTILECIKTKDKSNLIKNLKEIKEDFDIIDKTECVYVIVYWALGMNIGDIIFVRTSSGIVYICEVISDVKIIEYKDNLHPKRDIKVLDTITVEDFIQKFNCAKNRISVRKVLQRVANKEQKIELENFLQSFLEVKN